MDLVKNNLVSSAEDIAAKLQVRLSSCEKLDEFTSLLKNTVNVAGIILNKERIYDKPGDATSDLVGYKFTIHNRECVALYVAIDNVISIRIYDINLESLDVLDAFEVGDLVSFNGTLTCELISEEDMGFSFSDGRLSLVDVDWSAPYMIHKNFLAKLGISLSDN